MFVELSTSSVHFEGSNRNRFLNISYSRSMVLMKYAMLLCASWMQSLDVSCAATCCWMIGFNRLDRDLKYWL
ncbi:hypothetical protein OGAPHI_005315 [Ogataea philodendri]|uniref:Uncharacterized protein n=1 Tax=Ogataea philodendri TaxID=1378263 RepID=A0A9P8P1C6_9ASCO|nr:uncharacterized protein OGAPHI_005315 [Ogataea philodendri]KAH3663325.1 hypothetical protein OGAPHI_005315 [Ogataea philodendri]